MPLRSGIHILARRVVVSRMSILITNCILPPDDKMELILCIQHDGTVLDPWGNQIDTKAIELPPHGRLIDADALLKDHGLGTYCPECKRDERSCQFEMIHTTMDFCEWIEDAPAIIPANPEGGADG